LTNTQSLWSLDMIFLLFQCCSFAFCSTRLSFVLCNNSFLPSRLFSCNADAVDCRRSQLRNPSGIPTGEVKSDIQFSQLRADAHSRCKEGGAHVIDLTSRQEMQVIKLQREHQKHQNTLEQRWGSAGRRTS
jgi:hypothetical protein